MVIAKEMEILRMKNDTVKLSEVKDIIKLVPKMIDLMQKNNGCGIAAPQVGINKTFFVAILGGRARIFVNPQIIEQSNETETEYEGCLSVPGYKGLVERSLRIVLKYFDISTLKMKKEVFCGLEARIVQHEENHLRGIIYTDIAESVISKEEYESIIKLDSETKIV